MQCPKKLRPMRKAKQGNLYEKNRLLEMVSNIIIYIVPRNLEIVIIDVFVLVQLVPKIGSVQ